MCSCVCVFVCASAFVSISNSLKFNNIVILSSSHYCLFLHFHRKYNTKYILLLLSLSLWPFAYFSRFLSSSQCVSPNAIFLFINFFLLKVQCVIFIFALYVDLYGNRSILRLSHFSSLLSMSIVFDRLLEMRKSEEQTSQHTKQNVSKR